MQHWVLYGVDCYFMNDLAVAMSIWEIILTGKVQNCVSLWCSGDQESQQIFSYEIGMLN